MIGHVHMSTRKRLEGTLSKDHEDHIACNGFNSLSLHNLVHKFDPMPQAVQYTPMTKCEKLENLLA